MRCHAEHRRCMGRRNVVNPTQKLLAPLYGSRSWLLKQQWFTSRLLPALPRSLRWTLRRLYFLPSDLIERVLSNRDELVPPRSSIFTGSVDDFRSSGEALVRRLAHAGYLTPESKVLDIGSGMGRVAVALISYRDGTGSYQGLDIVPSGITWCASTSPPSIRTTPSRSLTSSTRS